jgi:FKBP-type peptidyl-prolyl cis-trans isomerase
MELQMKKMFIVLILLALVVNIACAEEKFKSQQEKIGYAIGMNIGMNLKQQQLDVDAAQIAAGLLVAIKGEKALLTQEEMKRILAAYQQEMQKNQMAKMAAEAVKNEKLAQEYLEMNSKQEGVVTLKSGLQYKVLVAGQGAIPKADSTVEVHYRGSLIDGTEFDNSYQREKPVSFPLKGVIPG